MSDAQKAMVKTAIAFVSGMKEIGQAAADLDLRRQAAVPRWSLAAISSATPSHTHNALTSSNMMGLVKQVGGAVADVGNGWASLSTRLASSTSSTSWRSLSPIKSRVWVTSLTESSGIGNTFIAMQPWSPRSSAGLTMSSAKWAAWTGSDKGQTKMLASLSRPRVPWRLLAGSLKRWVALQGPPL